MRSSWKKSRGMVLFVLMASLLVVGCGYGKVSPAAYEVAKALYSISNRAASDRLDHVEQQITLALDEQRISQKEAAWLRDILQQAREGRWEAAEQASRRMMEDQVGQ